MALREEQKHDSPERLVAQRLRAMLIAALNFRTFRASLVGIAALSGRSGEPARGHRRSRYDSALYLRRTPVASYEALRYRQAETGSVTWSANRSTRRIPRRARRVFARDWAGIRAGLGGCRLRRGKKEAVHRRCEVCDEVELTFRERSSSLSGVFRPGPQTNLLSSKSHCSRL